MRFDEYRDLDATSLAAAVRAGEVTPAELLTLARERAREVNPALNAIVSWQDAAADARAAGPLAGPMAGVPFLIKDLHQQQEGVPGTEGSRSCVGRVAAETDTIVQRWLDSGVVPFGRTNVPEFGAKGVTESDLHGPCRNPWDTARTPGGSSGGAAAAVAAGIVPVAGASDGGGSIRIPAACCGLFGLKPGRGVVPAGPGSGELLHGSAVDGVLSRTVRDSAAFLDIMAGTDPVAPPYAFASVDGGYLGALDRPVRPLRIGVQRRSALTDGPDPEVSDALDKARALLTELGHVVEEVRPDYDEDALAQDFLTPWYAHAALVVDELESEGRDGFEFDTRVMAAIGRSIGAVELERALAGWHTHSRALDEFHGRYDVLMTPTLATLPPTIGRYATSAVERIAGAAALRVGAGAVLGRVGAVRQAVLRNLSWVPFTQLANVTGRPAVSVPLFRTPAGLPIGIQFVGPVAGEATLFQLGAQLEEALPWAGHRAME